MHTAEIDVQPPEPSLGARLGELERSNRELTQFAAVVAHDLLEPLTTVIGYLELLMRRHGSTLNDDAQEMVTFALTGAGDCRALVEALLEYTAVGRQEHQTESVDTAELVARVVAALAGIIEAAGATVIVDPLPLVPGDHVQLARLFQNLISNAIKFRAHDVPATIRISAVHHGDAWRFGVTDNGIGIDAADRERVFATFKRLNTRASYSGTGLGLAICKKVVEAHGGRIWVEPVAGGRGSSFVFTLPKEPA